MEFNTSGYHNIFIVCQFYPVYMVFVSWKRKASIGIILIVFLCTGLVQGLLPQAPLETGGKVQGKAHKGTEALLLQEVLCPLGPGQER